jgi:predicted DsbA family dithiol-disulfide isomerase
MSSPARTIAIEIVSDAICPWCWIGKRHFERAAELLAGTLAITPVWKPFELNPDMPKAGIERHAYRIAKFGSLDHSNRLDANVRERGQAAGLDFRFDLIRRTPNTFDCHRLIRFASLEGRQAEVVEGLFRAYFNEGRDIGDHELMAEVAEAAGLDRRAVKAMLGSDQGAEDVARELVEARAMRISGVPTFVIDGEPVASGAAPPEILARAFAESAA